MKLPFIDIHIVKGRNVITDGQLKEKAESKYIQNKQVGHLLDKIEHLKELLRNK